MGIFTLLIANWRTTLYATLVALALSGAGFAYYTIEKRGYERRVAENAAAQVETLQRRLGALQLTAAADAARATADREQIDKLETQARETPKNDGVCLDADAARRVRAIGGSSSPVAAPVPAKRHSKLLPWRGGYPRPGPERK